MAELQNQQKRALRDKQEAQRYAESEFARELLVVIDDLERTLDSAKATTDAQALAEGVRIIYDHFLKVLRGRHIAPIESVGRPFDPAFHEALLQQPSADQPDGTVLQELASGHTKHELGMPADYARLPSKRRESRADQGKSVPGNCCWTHWRKRRTTEVSPMEDRCCRKLIKSRAVKPGRTMLSGFGTS